MSIDYGTFHSNIQDTYSDSTSTIHDTIPDETVSPSKCLLKHVSDISEGTAIAAQPAGSRTRTTSGRLVESLIVVGVASTVPTINEADVQARKSCNVIIGWNILNMVCGVGIVGIPYGVLLAGWVSIPLILLSAVLAHTSGVWLIDCLYHVSRFSNTRRRVVMSYAEIGHKAWPACGRTVVVVTMLVELFSVLVLMVLLLNQSSWQLANRYWNPDIDPRLWCVMATFATLPLILFRRVTLVTWFGTIAVGGLVCAIGAILAFCFKNSTKMTVTNIVSPRPVTIPVSFGIFVFSFCAHATFPTIEGSMSHPRSYPIVAGIAFTISTVLKIILGVSCVLIFGRSTDEQITNNLPFSDGIHVVIAASVAINVLFTIPLMVFVLNETIDGLLLDRFDPAFWSTGSCHWLWIAVIRIILLTGALLVGMLIPHFSLLMGCVGSITATLLSMIFPASFSLSLKWMSLSRAQVMLRICVCIFGVFVSLIGTISSVLKIRAVMSLQ